MKIVDDNQNVVQINDILDSIQSEYFWSLDLSLMDYTLAPLTMIEEVACPTFLVEVAGVSVYLPASWNMLIYDTDTGDVDLIPLCEMTGRTFTALGYGPNCVLAKPLPVKIMDYNHYYKNVGPALNKHQMLCYPVDSEIWFSVCAIDVYSKFLKNISLGDIIE